MRQVLADGGDLALIKRLGGHQDRRLSDGQPSPDRFRSEGREEGAEDRSMFEGPQRGHVEFRDTACQNEDSFSLRDPECLQNVGEAIAQVVESGVGVVVDPPIFSQPAQGPVRCQRSGCMASDGFIPDIHALGIRQSRQLFPRPFPRKLRADGCVVMQVWDDVPVAPRFDDREPRHRELRSRARVLQGMDHERSRGKGQGLRDRL